MCRYNEDIRSVKTLPYPEGVSAINVRVWCSPSATMSLGDEKIVDYAKEQDIEKGVASVEDEIDPKRVTIKDRISHFTW